MKKIFITGGSGLIGTNAVEYFLSKEFRVSNFDIRPPQNETQNSVWIKGDINDKQAYLEAVRQSAPDYFLHLAARTDLLETKDLHNGYATNIKGVENTIEVVNATPTIKRVLFASTRMVCRIDYIPKDYDDYCPPNLYGESKVLGEKIVKNAKINAEWCLFRPTSIWGPWFDVPYIIFFRTIQKNMYFHPGKHSPGKSFGYVKNATYQLDKLLTAEAALINHKTFYLCDYPPLNLTKWAEMIRKEMNSKRIPTYPIELLKTIAKVGDFLFSAGWKRAPLTTFRLNNLITNMVYDTTELEQICGPLPYTLECGVKETVEWMNNHTSRNSLAAVK